MSKPVSNDRRAPFGWTARKRAGAAFLVGIAVLALHSGPRPADAATAPQGPQGPPDYMKRVHVNGYDFDPLVALPPLPSRLRSPRGGAGGPGYSIVQFGDRVNEGMLHQLEAAGPVILQYLSYNAFIVRADGPAMSRARNLPSVRWTGDYEPAYKLSRRLETRFDRVVNDGTRRAYRNAGLPDAAPPLVDTTERLPIFAITLERSQLGAVEAAVRRLGGRDIRVSSRGRGKISADFPRSALEALAQEPSVAYIDREVPAFVVNETTRWVIQSNDAVTHATPVHDHGIWGTGQVVTLGDTGLIVGHNAFSDPNVPLAGPTHRKVTAYYTPPNATGNTLDQGPNQHGTHTSGTVAGDAGTWHVYNGSPLHDGQAFDAKIQMQDLSSDPGGLGITPPPDFTDMFQAALDHGSFIDTNSWGSSAAPYYDTQQMETDDFVWNNPDFLILFAAGNLGEYGSCTVNPQSSAKNVISVGATVNGTSANDVAYFSSRGPTVDGRLKPDLMAPGMQIWSAHWSCETFPCVGSSYSQLSGTSMATPAVAGAAALVRQYFMEGWYPTGAPHNPDRFTPSAALLKATLINSAVEMSGAGAYDNGETGYPNDNQGWGRILLDNALFFQGDPRSLQIRDERSGVRTGDTDTYTFTVTNASQPLVVTLAWSDRAGFGSNAWECGDPPEPLLVNDLDLTIVAPNGTEYFGNAFNAPPPQSHDRFNNVEGVRIGANVALGTWTVRVHGELVAWGDKGKQPYALVISGK